MDKKLKISSTAYRVLLLMNLLSQEEKNVDDLNKTFANDPYISRTLTKEVIVKYISTLKLSGYKISKPTMANNHSYTLLKSPVKIKLSEEELQTLAILDNYICSLYQNNLKSKSEEFISKLSCYLDEEEIAFLNNERKKICSNLNITNKKYAKYAETIRMLEKYCNEERRIQVTYNLPYDESKIEVVLEPKNIKYDANNVYLAGFNAVIGERQLLNIDYIKEIKQLPQKSRFNQILSPVIFKIKGRLSKGYSLYEGEKITELNENGSKTITTYVDDKNMLLQRLLKYGDLCEVIYPKDVRQKISGIIDETLKNYEN